MNLRLFVSKMKSTKNYSTRNCIHFAVVDLDRTREYPANFVCVLPQHLSFKTLGSSIFAQKFGERRLDVAKELLSEALKRENDSEVRAEIRERLKLLNQNA